MKIKSPFLFTVAAGCLLSSVIVCLPILSAEEAQATKTAKLPFAIYVEKGSASNHYAASGWMGNTKGVKVDEGWANNPHGGKKSCLRVEYSDAGDWAGIVWQDPANDWGEQPGGWNLKGAKKLKFWARGEKGGENVNFKFGILGADKKYSDTASGETGETKLTKEWKEYTIDLEGKDLSRIKTGFVWSLAGQGAPVVFFLNDIRYE